MKFTGKELISMSTKKDGKNCFTISDFTLNKLTNGFISDRICKELNEDGYNEKLITDYIIIDGTRYYGKSYIRIKMQAYLKDPLPFDRDRKYNVEHFELKVRDFYNFILDTFDSYAYELDTTIDNILVDIIEIENCDTKKNSITKEDNIWKLAVNQWFLVKKN